MPELATFRLSTDKFPQRKRLSMWREEFGDKILRVDIEPLSDIPFHARSTLRILPGLNAFSSTSSPLRFRRTSDGPDADGSIALIINMTKDCVVSQRGREVTLRAGDAVAVHHRSRGSASFAEGSYFALVIPRAELASRLSNLDEPTMQPIPREQTTLRLIRSYMRPLWDELRLATSDLRSLVATHVHDLAAMMLSREHLSGESNASAVVATRLAAVLDYIGAHFDDPELNLDTVAHSQGVSPRYLQRLLETSGSSFTAQVNELRLQRAFALLTEPAASPRLISDIALEVGFSDISYFNRSFHSRFGESPSGIRTQSRRSH
ncbi:AraC family transcriptional regulator [Bradyrhizobium sp. CCGUVB23]|uniref:helix-turn-helix transcriptional regulator n=1 Tax=Bradyrhizobium sp. CCGUVB23 TaxID=2949630 RepID=UPI0004811415|nr:AraC family transcriptional regulator [Bradyrhizobium sp. CCGUVB23]MCP3462514.1 AraC family transcriptional regulator [Bradyrhizobium sp. CCGUVB23]